MLKSVKRPNGLLVTFEYDALGRRTAKIAGDKITRYLWDGNVLIHEWCYDIADRPKLQIGDLGELFYEGEEPKENVITWVYETGSFTPVGKLINGERFSIISDYLGTPTQAYNSEGEVVWERELNIYGGIRKETGISNFVAMRYQGQYFDEETELCYNRFRYYDCSTGYYVSQDPIGLAAGQSSFYAYVNDTNIWVDVYGLSGTITIFSDSPKGDPIGHAFIKVTENGNFSHVGQWPDPGFSKGDLPSILVSDMGGALNHDDISHLKSPDLVSRTYNIDDNQMKNLKSFVKDFDSKNTATSGYNLRSRQCASFAHGAAMAAGIDDMKMPWYKWVTPNSLSDKIKSLNKKLNCK